MRALALALALAGGALAAGRAEPARTIVPLTSDEGWQVLAYDGIPAHMLRFSETGLRIDVKESSAPLVYPLDMPRRVGFLRARGAVVSGELAVPPGRQGEKGFDDYALRLGLVEIGSRRPGFFERLAAPRWLRALFALAPPGTGVSQVRFFNVGADEARVGQARRHPLNALLHETVAGVPDAEGRFVLEVPVDPPAEVAAVWLGPDGDDTGSTFTVTLEQVELVAPQAP